MHEELTVLELGYYLKSIRVKRRKTMGDVARELGTSVVYVSDCERGFERPSQIELALWCRLLAPNKVEKDTLGELWCRYVARRREHTIHTMHGSWATGDQASGSAAEPDCG